jgi:hypothetical protein
MKQSFTRFIIILLGLTIVLYGISFFVFTRLIILPMPSEIMLGVLFLVTAVFHFLVTKAAEKSPQVFTRTYMGLSSARLILYSIFLLVYCFGHRDIAKVFVLTFFILYIIYTAFEVRSVQAYFKRK